jgi:hypothetical protein
MAVPFSYPPENMTSILDLFSHANTLTDGFLGVGILIAIAIIAFITTKAFSTEKAFGFSGFLSLLVAILLRFMGLINNTVLYITIIAFVGIMIWVYNIR